MDELALYDEIADFLATAAPAETLAFRPSESTQTQFEELIEKKKTAKSPPMKKAN